MGGHNSQENDSSDSRLMVNPVVLKKVFRSFSHLHSFHFTFISEIILLKHIYQGQNAGIFGKKKFSLFAQKQ